MFDNNNNKMVYMLCYVLKVIFTMGHVIDNDHYKIISVGTYNSQLVLAKMS